MRSLRAPFPTGRALMWPLWEAKTPCGLCGGQRRHSFGGFQKKKKGPGSQNTVSMKMPSQRAGAPEDGAGAGEGGVLVGRGLSCRQSFQTAPQGRLGGGFPHTERGMLSGISGRGPSPSRRAGWGWEGPRGDPGRGEPGAGSKCRGRRGEDDERSWEELDLLWVSW